MPAAPWSRLVRSLLLGSVLLGSTLAGLACKTGDAPPAGGDGAADGSSASEVEEPSGPTDVVLRAVAAPGIAPERLVLRVGSTVFPEDVVGGLALDDTRLVLQPAVDGSLRITGRDELTFEPVQGFRPGTRYTATLEQLQTFEGSLQPEAGDAWTLSFDTPDLSLVRLAPRQRDRLAGTAEVDLVFSAAVDAAQVAERLDIRVDGKPLRPASVQRGDGDHLVRVRLQGSALSGEEIEVSAAVAQGLPWAWDDAVRGQASQVSTSMADGKPVTIHAVMVKEGVDGHYLEVVCSDPSVGNERWYWDRDTWDGWDVTSRCMLTEDDAARAITVSQGGPVSIAQGPAGFRIFGDFPQGPLTLRIDAGARTVDGGMVPEAWEGEFEVPARQPRLDFASKGRYLPRSAWRSLALEHLNTPEVRLQVRHVPPANLAFWLSGDESASERTSALILDQDIVLGGATDETLTAWIDVGGLLPDAGQGIYEVSVQGKDDASSARATSRLLLTDMHLVAKRATPRPGSTVPPEVQAWVVGVHDNQPLSGVELQLVRPNGQALSTCRTGSDGGCLLTVPDPGVDPTPPMAVIARRGQDLTYLAFADVQVRPEADTSGEPYRSAVAYRAAAWSDRGVYRPGDVAHVAALLRTEGYTAPELVLPVVAKVTDSRGREVRREALETNVAGMVELAVPLADFAATGTWRVELQVADRTVGSLSFAVEEFVPERMAVDAQVAEGALAGGWLQGDEVPVQVEARWLFGGSAADSRVEVDCELVASPFVPGGGDDSQARWSYGLAFVDQQPPPPVALGRLEEQLDADGRGTWPCPVADRGAGLLGSAELRAKVAVFEGDSGRATREVARGRVHPATHYIGLSTKVDTVSRGDSFAVEGKVVDWLGKPAPGAVSEVELRLYRMEEEYGWIWDEEMGDTAYRRTLRRVQEDRRTVPVKDGRFTAQLSAPADAAGWLVDVRGGGARTERFLEGSERHWYWDPWSSTVDQTPRPQRPTFLPVQAPELAQVGETVKVTTTAPYAGRMLLTVETDRVQHSQWQSVQPGPVQWSVPLDIDDGDGGDFAPNVYVTALLLKDPHLESKQAFLPDRAYGAASIRIEPKRWSLPVTVKAPEEARPWEPLKVSLDLGAVEPGTYATVAVVDEGILQLTDFETPDPRTRIFARRALGVDSFETVGWTLLDQPSGSSSRSGGDASGSGVGRVQMVKPVALWSGMVPVPADGKVDVSFDIPGYRGKLRVMAVAAGRTRMGSAEASVVVREPIVLQTTLPRFLVAGDVARIPVRLTNTTSQARSVQVEVQVEELPLGLPGAAAGSAPSVEVVDPPGAALQLAPDEAGTVLFSLAARRAPGAVRLVVTAKAGDLRSREELELPVANAEPEQWRHELVQLRPGTTSLASTLDGWKSGTDQSRVWVTGSPFAGALTHLGYLVRYPYGCIEQTTSSTRPLLYVRDLVQQIDPALVARGSVDEMVASGIERVLSMQTPSGGFAYWPGGSYPDEWGTVYGLHLLLDARKAGYTVPDRAVERAVSWLETRAGTRVEADSTLAYAHYVLALAGRARPAQAQRVLEAWQAVQPASRRTWEVYRKTEAEYLLMAALYQGGDRRHEATLKALSQFDEIESRVNDRSYWSSLRGAGLRLSVFQDLFGNDPAGDAAAELLAAWVGRRSSSRYTTQELAWAITALGKRTQAGAAGIGSTRLLVDGKPAKAQAEGAWGLAYASSASSVQVEAPSLSGRAWALVSTRGVRTDDPVPTGSQGLAVKRTWLDGAGRPLDPGRLPLGTPIYVRVDLSNTSGASQENIALVDRLPAGWEIENPRLSDSDLPDWARGLDLWSAEHMNLRDDRVEVFGSLPRGSEVSVLYAVRAVTSGSFVVPPVQAEAMYDPDLWARQAGRTVDVVGPWDDGLL